jgi:hypothetical protein
MKHLLAECETTSSYRMSRGPRYWHVTLQDYKRVNSNTVQSKPGSTRPACYKFSVSELEYS